MAGTAKETLYRFPLLLTRTHPGSSLCCGIKCFLLPFTVYFVHVPTSIAAGLETKNVEDED